MASNAGQQSATLITMAASTYVSAKTALPFACSGIPAEVLAFESAWKVRREIQPELEHRLAALTLKSLKKFTQARDTGRRTPLSWWFHRPRHFRRSQFAGPAAKYQLAK